MSDWGPLEWATFVIGYFAGSALAGLAPLGLDVLRAKHETRHGSPTTPCVAGPRDGDEAGGRRVEHEARALAGSQQLQMLRQWEEQVARRLVATNLEDDNVPGRPAPSVHEQKAPPDSLHTKTPDLPLGISSPAIEEHGELATEKPQDGTEGRRD